MCKFCNGKNNFGEVGIKEMFNDGVNRVYLCGGNSKPSEDERFDFCPKCGTPLGKIKPLTVEQLKEMDGKPVFIETGEVSINEQIIGRWHIIHSISDTHAVFMGGGNGFRLDYYGTTWQAFDREFTNKR